MLSFVQSSTSITNKIDKNFQLNIVGTLRHIQGKQGLTVATRIPLYTGGRFRQDYYSSRIPQLLRVPSETTSGPTSIHKTFTVSAVARKVEYKAETSIHALGRWGCCSDDKMSGL